MALDFDDLMKLPPTMKALIIGLVFAVLGYFAFTFFVQSAMDKYSDLGTTLTDLRQQVAEKEKIAAQMGRYIREIDEARESFRTALLKLPSEKEIPELLASIAATGTKSGVDFVTFEPKLPEPKPPEPKPGAPMPPPKPADAKSPPVKKPAAPEKFYEEIPVKVQLTGSFHNVLSFFEATATLPRIVNIEDIAMTDARGSERPRARPEDLLHLENVHVRGHKKMMTRRAIALSLCGVLMLMIGGGMAIVEAWAAEMKAASPGAPPIDAAKPVVKSAPPVAPQPSSPTVYHAVGKSDPFHPFIETDPAVQNKLEMDLKKKAVTKARPISPLQQSEIEQFRLVGIAGDDKRRTAVVEDGAVKKFYALFVGTVIGPNEGRVVEILPDRVIVEERIEDANPKTKKAQVRRITMMLRKEE